MRMRTRSVNPSPVISARKIVSSGSENTQRGPRSSSHSFEVRLIGPNPSWASDSCQLNTVCSETNISGRPSPVRSIKRTSRLLKSSSGTALNGSKGSQPASSDRLK